MTSEKTKLKAGACFAAAALVAALIAAARILGCDSPVSQTISAAAVSAAVSCGASILYRASKNGKIMKRALAVIFAVYLLLLINFTVFDGHFGRVTPEEISNVSFSEYFKQRGNLIPFRMIFNQTKALLKGIYRFRFFAVNIVGNLIAFAPFALFLPLFFKKCRKYAVFFAVMTLIVLSVETCQLLLRVGSFDVDDYILNMLGATAAFFLLSSEKGEGVRRRLLEPNT